MTSLTNSKDAENGEDRVSSVSSWTSGLARVGGFYQDADWYNVNISRYKYLQLFLYNIDFNNV